MDSTSVSLLLRLRNTQEQEAWSRFVQIYAPLVESWIRPFGLPAQDAEEMVQEVFSSLIRELPKFDYDANRSFRAWLSTVTRNAVRSYLRRRGPKMMTNAADNLDGLLSDDAYQIDAKEFREYVTQRALLVMKSDFEPATWQAFWRVVTQGESGVEVARDLGMSVNAVYVAKHRVLRRLREELEGMLEDGESF